MDSEIRVLHVDDDPEFLGLAQTLLERADDRFTVVTATSPDAGLPRLADGRFHCVVSDYEMPGRDGIEFLEAVRARDDRLPFLLFTGRGSEAVASDAISAGVTDYLQKGTGTDQFEVLANRIANAVAGDQARRQLDVLVDNLPGIVYQHRDEAEWPLTLIRGNCEELMGYTAEELESDVALAEQAIHPDDRAFHNETLREGLAENGSYELTYRVLHADGSERWVLDSGQRHEAPFGDGTMFSGVLVDVEETKRYERELQTTKRRLDAILEHTTTPMFMKAADGRHLLVNRGYRELFGLSPGEAVGETDETLHPPERAATLTATDETALETGEAVESEDVLEIDGRDRTFLVTEVPLYDVGTAADSDEPVGVFGVAQEVTDRLDRERHRRRRDDQIDALAGVLSHDLATPVSTARGRLEAAAETGDPDHVAAAADAVERIDEIRTELARVLRDGTFVDELTPVALADAADRVWATLETETASLRTRTDAVVAADERALERLLGNLLCNAVAHGGDGVTVTVGATPDGFYVADDGPGVPPADRDRVFEPGVSSRDGAEHGMGLVSVSQIATAHEWDVSVTESADGGARFELAGVTFAG